ncbi:MAG: protein of unknown function YccS/YhfK [Bryobacterales bacterium]|nr:protein of unknown function YccS/YhfK [Bryobacterales bacterium]
MAVWEARKGPKATYTEKGLIPQPDRSWTAFWRTVTKFERDKITPGLALRNSVGVVLPIAVGIAIGKPAAGLVVGAGALNVCFSDGPEPYRHRARRMLTASVLVGLAVFAGAVSGRNDALAMLLAGVWAFAAGMAVALGQEPADLGTVSLVTLVVFAAQSLSPKDAAIAGLLALGGGLLQTGLALALWPVGPHFAERRELGNLYRELAQAAASPIPASEAPPATDAMLKAQKALATLGRAHSIEAERYRSLLSQAERIRLCIMALARLRARIRRQSEGSESSKTIDDFLVCASRVLLAVGNSLTANGAATAPADCMERAVTLADSLRLGGSGELAALVHDARLQLDALAGQLRAALDLARNATPEGSLAFEEREARRSWRLRLGGTIAILRANLTFESAAFRHAIRLAIAVALGDALGRMVALRRPYWIPMTIAIVLKPDFTSTFSRGILRLAGTFAGLALATALFHAMAPSPPVQVFLIGAFVFILRWVGGANYGIFVTAVSALVVLLIAITGITPQQVIAARGLNTAAGGTLALLAYIVWPTWERTHVAEALARMLDAYRDYFRAVAQAYIDAKADMREQLDRARQGARLARSNAEASVDRLAGEPGASPEEVAALQAMLASSHRLVHAVMALEAGLTSRQRPPARPAFRILAHLVERTLHSLAEALRGSPLRAEDLPDLRAGHQQLIGSGDLAPERYELSNVETDRIVNSLNTLAEQVLRWISKRR